jgi:hypothetical protein
MLMYGGECSSLRVCVSLCEGVSWKYNWHNLMYCGALKFQMLLSGNIIIRWTNDVAVMIVISV